jgi:molecular chaperone DnaK (HSP70)
MHKFKKTLKVPAMWSDKSKQIMREAAIKANIISASDHTDRLMLISEPEAAALYCEKTCDRFNMVNGDEFMVCDAGGKY